MSILIGLALVFGIGTIAYVVASFREGHDGAGAPVAGQRLSAAMRRQHDVQRQIFEATADQVLWEASKNFDREIEREQHDL